MRDSAQLAWRCRSTSAAASTARHRRPRRAGRAGPGPRPALAPSGCDSASCPTTRGPWPGRGSGTPPSTTQGSVVDREDRLGVVARRHLQPRVGAGRAQPAAIVTARDSDGRVLAQEQGPVAPRARRAAARPSPPDPGRRARLTAWRTASMVVAVPASVSSMRSSILPPSRPTGGDARRVVPGEPVVHRPGGAVEAAAVHRADDDLVLERAEEQQLLDDVGGAEHAVDVRVAAAPRPGGRAASAGRPSPSRRRRTRAHRGPGGRRDEEQRPPLGDDLAGAAPGGVGAGDRAGLGGAALEQVPPLGRR